MEHEHVFAYGSLIAAAGEPAELAGHERWWGAAMDNRVTLGGYKHYVAQDGGRPAVHVTFLDLRPRAGARVNGLCIAVDAAQLQALDRRERNYVRTDVTALVAFGAAGPDASVWTYVGSAAGRERCAQARAAGTAVIARDYLEGVRAGFAALGGGALERFEATTAPAGLPVSALRRIDHAG